MSTELYDAEIRAAIDLLAPVAQRYLPIMVCGNGGSASDAEHIVAELVGSFKNRSRPPINAISLGSNAAVVTAIANDFNYDDVFARQVLAHGRRGGALIAISTSGMSINVIKAVEEARELTLPVIVLTRESEYANLDGDVVFRVPSSDTATIQEAHIQIYHRICYELERLFTHTGGYDELADLSRSR